jgi:tRNA(Ile)-lysidine synthase
MTRTAGKPPASTGPDEAVAPDQAERFAADLARLRPDDGPLGLAVSGGPDSLALLLLAQAAIPGRFAVATVNHGLRPEAAAECALVERVCAERGIRCATLPVEVAGGNLQAAAREARYAALAAWAGREGLAALVTAHHADDQAETLVMRLNRASGLSGLAGVRSRGVVPAGKLSLLRPLLRWRRHELASIVERTGIEPARDPSNTDDHYDRVRIRKALAATGWLDPLALAESAEHLADADDAIEWIVRSAWDERVSVAAGGAIRFEPGMPRAVALRIVARIVEGFGSPARGGSVARLVDGLAQGWGGNVAGVAARGDADGWLFRQETRRRG